MRAKAWKSFVLHFGYAQNFSQKKINTLDIVLVNLFYYTTIANFWNVILVTFHFPEAMQHNFVLKSYTHSLE